MIILASASPRRRELLERAGLRFTVAAADVEEWNPERGDPVAVAAENARRKATAVSGEAVLGADTVVALGDRILGKPADAADARRMLAALSGTTHRVVTGVALATRGRVAVRTVETTVTMRPLEPEEIDGYVASGEAMGKAGAYAIQGGAGGFVTRLAGPRDNVVGLPVEAVRALLRECRIEE